MSEPSSTGPDGGPDSDTDIEPAVVAFAGLWSRELASANFVPGGRARARQVLRTLTGHLVGALSTRPFDARPGRQVGADLVANHMSAPAALGVTMRLLGNRMLTDLRITDPAAPVRLDQLRAEVATGFAEALRDLAQRGAESINRAERDAWRRQQRELLDRLQHAPLHDPLTGLPNRAALTRRIETFLAASAPAERLAVCLLGLQRFTAVSDSLGTATGDELLLDVAHQLRNMADERGYQLAHLGGDTFALLVEGSIGRDDAVKCADAALTAIPDPWLVGEHEIPLGAKAGVVERLAHSADAAGLLRAASVALHWAQQEPSRSWQLFDHARDIEQVRRHAITHALPAALRTDQFTVAYQPVVQLRDGTVAGFEALARWQHPRLGPINPTEFISQANDIGLISELSLHIFRLACQQATRWRGAFAPFVSVNLAVAQLQQSDLPATVARVLTETGLPPRQLQLEITEEALADAAATAGRTLRELAEFGIRLAIDDFGAGHANLIRLSELPINAVKLDARFLTGIESDSPDRRSGRLLDGVVRLVHSLDLTVTAEGIETAAQTDTVTILGCDHGQGFHLGEPMTIDNATILLGQQQQRT